MSSGSIIRTTRAVRDVKSIEDIVAIESVPYDANVSARSLYDLISATARLHPERPAVTTLAADRSLEPLLSLTHSQLLFEVTRAANLFASLNQGRESVVAVLCPTFPEIPVALLGAQVVGVASAINYLLNVEAIADLLVAQRATALIVPGLDRDAAIAEKVQPILERVPGLETVLHIGDLAPAKSNSILSERASAPQRRTAGTRRAQRPVAGLRAFSYGRHDRPSEACPADARQPDPCGLVLRAGPRPRRA